MADCVHDALTATYTRQLKELEPRAALSLARLFFCLVAQWNALRVIALHRSVPLVTTDHDARSVTQWRTVLLSEAEVMNSLCAEWHVDA